MDFFKAFLFETWFGITCSRKVFQMRNLVIYKLGNPDFNRASQKRDVKGDLVFNYAKTKQNCSSGKG